ncbi:hypothetical protein GE09DRAFT_94432 [Coniochaeta sp. 2T2.1]|nr:hypothetical protein GE09DRAFT_94432 [Coniochaeta sp. 2T2.1]
MDAGTGNNNISDNNFDDSAFGYGNRNDNYFDDSAFQYGNLSHNNFDTRGVENGNFNDSIVDQASFARSVQVQASGSNAEHTQGFQSHDMLRNIHDPFAVPGPSGMATAAQVSGGLNARPETARAQSSNNLDYMTYGNVGGSDAGLAQVSFSASEIGLGQGSLFDRLGGQGGSAESGPFGLGPSGGPPRGTSTVQEPEDQKIHGAGPDNALPRAGRHGQPEDNTLAPRPRYRDRVFSCPHDGCDRLLGRWRSVGRHCWIDHMCSSKHVSDIDRAESYVCSHGDCDYRAFYRPNMLYHCEHHHSCSIVHGYGTRAADELHRAADGKFHCSHAGCKRHNYGYEQPGSLIRHINEKHGGV